MKRLKTLDLNHKAAARMRVEGLPNEAICKKLGIKERTLHYWMSDDLMKAEIQRLADAVESEFAGAIARSGMIALEEMLTLAQRDTPDRTISPTLKIQAATEIMDRLPALARVRDRVAAQPAGSGGNTNIEKMAVLIGKMPDQELAGVARQLLERASSSNGSDPA